MVAVPVIGKVGDRITPHFRDFGRLDGFVSDTVDGGFLLELDLTKPTREEFASKLFWLLAKQRNPSIGAKRQHPRFIPCVYRKPKPGRSDGEVRQVSRVI
jgi:hypothetical protein